MLFLNCIFFIPKLCNILNVFNILQCLICNLTCGNCFRCSVSNCYTWFHISCGIFAGYDYQINQKSKHITLIHCHNHCFVPDKVSYSSYCLICQLFYRGCLYFQHQIVHIKQKVWARHLQHKRISECQIVKIDKTPLGIVKFRDGTISDGIKLNEIKVFLFVILFVYYSFQVKIPILNPKFTMIPKK